MNGLARVGGGGNIFIYYLKKKSMIQLLVCLFSGRSLFVGRDTTIGVVTKRDDDRITILKKLSNYSQMN